MRSTNIRYLQSAVRIMFTSLSGVRLLPQKNTRDCRSEINTKYYYVDRSGEERATERAEERNTLKATT